MPNPIQQKNHPLQGVFDALEQIGTHLATKGQEERKRMIAIRDDPAQASQMATVIRQAAASGRTNEEIAMGLGFTGDEGVPFVNMIAATHPQGSAERLEEAAVNMDLSGLSAEEIMGRLQQNIATTTAQEEQGAAGVGVTAQVTTDRLTTAQANQRLDFTERYVAQGGTEIEADNAMSALENQGLELDTSIDGWERYNATVESWRSSNDPELQHFAELAAVGLKNPTSVSHIAQHEDRDWRASLQDATTGNMDFMDMLTIVDKINGMQQDIAERREVAMTLRGAERERAMQELRLEAAGVANLEAIAAGMHPVLGASLTGGPTVRRDSRGRPRPGTSELISGPARLVRDGLRQGFIADPEGNKHAFSIEDAEARLEVLESDPNALPGTLEDVRWEIEVEKQRREIAAGNPILAQFGAGAQSLVTGMSAMGPAMLQAALQIELNRELIAPEFVPDEAGGEPARPGGGPPDSTPTPVSDTASTVNSTQTEVTRLSDNIENARSLGSDRPSGSQGEGRSGDFRARTDNTLARARAGVGGTKPPLIKKVDPEFSDTHDGPPTGLPPSTGLSNAPVPVQAAWLKTLKWDELDDHYKKNRISWELYETVARSNGRM